MRVYLIDPEDCMITEVEYDGAWQTIAPMIDAHYFNIVRVHDNGDSLYVDEEALARPPSEDTAFFRVDGLQEPIVGKALYMALSMGETVEPTATIDEVREAVRFSSEHQGSDQQQ